ncbi:5277_t:CDS:2 [Entrophospora sp. SA101]|nr:5277_t:CDS:2 [Entrophospora sp. SA101]
MSNNISLTSLSLTHVEFDPTDSIAYIFAYITLSPLAIMVAYVTIIVSRREVAGINIFIGQSICELFNAILKRWLREKRPTDRLGTGYGMPLSHAQFIAFLQFLQFYIYITESLIRPLGFYKYLINTDLARSFYLRDSALVPDVLRFEYIFWAKFKDYKEI